MKRLIDAAKTPAARSTAIFYIGNFGLNVGRYLFHLMLLRFLTPPQYGEFLSYLSLTYLLGIPSGTVANVVTKHVSDLKGRGDIKEINSFFYQSIKAIIPITTLLGLSLIIFAQPLSILFKAHSIAFVVLGVSMLIGLVQTVIGSYVMAFQKFIFQTIVGYLSVVLVILFSILFIRLGLGATGAVLGQIVSGIFISLLSFFAIKQSIYPPQISFGKKKFHFGNLASYSLIFSIGTLSLISTDILVVRASFDPLISGLYSSLSILGRMIYFGLSPLTVIALPVAAHRFSSTGSAKSVLIKLGSVMTALGLVGVGIFSFFPNLVVKYLSGAQYLAIAPFLFHFSLAMLFFSLSQFLLSYFLAIGKVKSNILLLIVAILQPIVIILLPHTLEYAVNINLALQSLLLFSLLIYLKKA